MGNDKYDGRQWPSTHTLGLAKRSPLPGGVHSSIEILESIFEPSQTTKAKDIERGHSAAVYYSSEGSEAHLHHDRHMVTTVPTDRSSSDSPSLYVSQRDSQRENRHKGRQSLVEALAREELELAALNEVRELRARHLEECTALACKEAAEKLMQTVRETNPSARKAMLDDRKHQEAKQLLSDIEQDAHIKLPTLVGPSEVIKARYEKQVGRIRFLDRLRERRILVGLGHSVGTFDEERLTLAYEAQKSIEKLQRRYKELDAHVRKLHQLLDV